VHKKIIVEIGKHFETIYETERIAFLNILHFWADQQFERIGNSFDELE